MEANPRRMHPLVAVAAGSVILVSLTGVAAITGLLPSSQGNTPAALAASAPEAAPIAPPQAAAPIQVAAATPPAPVQPRQIAQAQEAAPPAPAPAAKPAAVCNSCGRVEAIQEVHKEGQGSGLGIAAGAILGGVLGNQVGGGSGRKVATVAGAVGGGYAGNAIEKHARSETSYQVRVRMENGKLRSFPYNNQPPWQVGDRIRVVDGYLKPRT